MMKKIILILVIVFVILLIGAVGYIFYLNYDGILDRSHELSREEVIQLLEKGSNYPNMYIKESGTYEIEGTSEKFIQEKYIKDSMEKIIVNGKLILIKNEVENKTYHFLEEENRVIVIENAEPLANTQRIYGYEEIVDQDYQFKYSGEKQVNGRDTIIVKLFKNSQETIKYYIDKETGVLFKRIYVWNYRLMKRDNPEEIKFDVVTNQEVEMPDLSIYEISE